MKIKWKKILWWVMIVVALTMMSACGRQQMSSVDGTEASDAVETSEEFLDSLIVQNNDDPTDISDVPTVLIADEKIEVVNASPYSGLSTELGAERVVENVYAFQFTNVSEQIIEEATVCFSNGQQEFTFELEMLIPGEPVFVTTDVEYSGIDATLFCEEASCKTLNSEQSAQNALQISGVNGILTVKNITDEFLPILRIYYREYDDNDIYQGAACGCAIIDGLNAGEEVEVGASEWTDRCAVIYVEQIEE